MNHEEALSKIYDMLQENSRLHGVISDLFYMIQHPERFRGLPSKMAHAHAGENTIWSIKLYAQWMKKLTGGDILLGGGYKDVYAHTGEWDVCDDCGEITLCTNQLVSFDRSCIYCRSKKFIERCCDKSEYLDGELMRTYLQTGEINPLLKWIPDHTWDGMQDYKTMMPLKADRHLRPVRIFADPAIPPCEVDKQGRIIPSKEPYITLPRLTPEEQKWKI